VCLWTWVSSMQCACALLSSVRLYRIFPHYFINGMIFERKKFTHSVDLVRERLCGLVVRVSGYGYRGLGLDSRRYQIFCVVVGLERGPLSLVRSIEELLE
jgi:hypothetical protein